MSNSLFPFLFGWWCMECPCVNTARHEHSSTSFPQLFVLLFFHSPVSAFLDYWWSSSASPKMVYREINKVKAKKIFQAKIILTLMIIIINRYISQSSQELQNQQPVYVQRERERLILRNWLMPLCELLSLQGRCGTQGRVDVTGMSPKVVWRHYFLFWEGPQSFSFKASTDWRRPTIIWKMIFFTLSLLS